MTNYKIRPGVFRVRVCPWCKHRSSIISDHRSGNNSTGRKKRKFLIECQNPKCIIKPQSRWFITSSSAVKAWNKGADDGSLYMTVIDERGYLMSSKDIGLEEEFLYEGSLYTATSFPRKGTVCGIAVNPVRGSNCHIKIKISEVSGVQGSFL